jgi:hypothetical protein
MSRSASRIQRAILSVTDNLPDGHPKDERVTLKLGPLDLRSFIR